LNRTLYLAIALLNQSNGLTTVHHPKPNLNVGVIITKNC